MSLRVRAAVAVLVAVGVAAPAAAVPATDPTPLGSRPGLAPDRQSEPLAGERAAARASTAPQTRFQMPFPCGQSWTGSTRDSHSPSRYSVDWNRTDDEDDPVVASAPGVVIRAERWTTSYGHWVMIEHPSGETTIYAHMNAVTVALGQTVDQGTQVGTVGNTGNSFGAHLHFEERSSGGSVRWPWFDGSAFSFGSTQASRNCVDVPLAGNFLRDGKAEVAVFRRGDALEVPDPAARPGHRRSSASAGRPTSPWSATGTATATPTSACGPRGPGPSRCRPPAGVTSVVLGKPRDLPLAGDWDGDGRWEVGVRRAKSGRFVLRAADGTTRAVDLGDVSDVPVTGDWDGDGVTDLGVYDQAAAVFTLRLVDRDGLTWTAEVPFGTRDDLPVTGDWDANGRTDLGTWNPATAVFSQRRAPAPTAARLDTTTRTFGRPR